MNTLYYFTSYFPSAYGGFVAASMVCTCSSYHNDYTRVHSSMAWERTLRVKVTYTNAQTYLVTFQHLIRLYRGPALAQSLSPVTKWHASACVMRRIIFCMLHAACLSDTVSAPQITESFASLSTPFCTFHKIKLFHLVVTDYDIALETFAIKDYSFLNDIWPVYFLVTLQTS